MSKKLLKLKKSEGILDVSNMKEESQGLSTKIDRLKEIKKESEFLIKSEPIENNLSLPDTDANSAFSYVSEILQPQKRGYVRSEESKRRSKTRHEFAKRLRNGSMPDKSELTMLDLIILGCKSTQQYPTMDNDMEAKELPVSPEYVQVPVIIKNEITIEENQLLLATNIKKEPFVNEDNVTENLISLADIKKESSEVVEDGDQKETLCIQNLSVPPIHANDACKGFYSRNKRSKDWKGEETIKFYRCLQRTGTDFSVMGAFFPTRERHELKAKYKKEEKINSKLIQKILENPKAFDTEKLKLELETDHKKGFLLD